MGRRKRTGGPAFSLFAFQDIVTCVMGIMLLLTLMLSLQIESTPETQFQSKVRQRVELLQKESSRLFTEIERMEADLSIQRNALNSGAVLDSTLLAQSRERALQDAASAEAESRRAESVVQASSAILKDVRTRYEELGSIQAESALLEHEIREKQKQLDELKSGQRRVYNAHESNSKTCWIVELTSPNNILMAVMGDEANATSFPDIVALEERIAVVKNQDVAVMLLVKPDAAGSLENLSKSLIEMRIPFGFDLLPQDVVVLGSVAEKTP